MCCICSEVTHGLCGKEGAMLFKRVLKGIRRLMLTTAVMCGVGLFLCSSEVKADPTLTITSTSNTNLTDNRFVLGVDNSGGTSNITVTKIDFYKSNSSGTLSDPISSVYLDSNNTIAPSVNQDVNITNEQFIKGYSGSNTGNVSIAGVSVTYSVDGSSDVTKTVIPISDVTTAPIYEVSAVKASSFSEVQFHPTFEYKVGERNSQYGYYGESYTISNQAGSADNYYMLSKKGSSPTFLASDTEWKDCKDVSQIASGTIGTENVSYEVAYLPKVTGISVSDSLNTTNTKLLGTDNSKSLSAISGSIEEISTDITFGIDSFISSEESSSDKSAIQGYYKIECTPYLASANTPMTLTVPNDSVTSNKFKLKMKLNSTASGGAGKVVIKLVLGSLQDPVASVDLPIVLNCKPTNLLLQNVPISLIAGSEEKTVKIFKGVEPGGANQDPSSYEGTLSFDKPALFEGTPTYNPSTGEITIKASSTATAGSIAKVTLTLTDKFNNVVSQSFDVKIISFSKDNTIKSINKNNKNYITYNKDKGYSLDIKQLIIDNAKDTSDNTVTITKDQIKSVSVGGSPCSDGMWKPSEAALNQKVSCKINGVQISESDGLKVSAYPMPTATYSSSNLTLSVKIPTKVATAYSDDNNIRQSKGFKLILEDSSGNTLYEYTDSKYQSVLSSSSESTVTYTVPAADIEGMITSAASNGKFSADTTSVKFKVIPMGYKQSSTSDETIKAKDEIAGKTDAVTVYKVSASGTNFTSSAAYGLDGQTVSITATPNSGYSFKQWSDGNTSNPRQVKVSASGTRAFQAVAGDRVANSTGAGGTDNSELYDDVPKTAESNSAIWLIVFMVFAVMGTTYALYLQLRAANSKHDR